MADEPTDRLIDEVRESEISCICRCIVKNDIITFENIDNIIALRDCKGSNDPIYCKRKIIHVNCNQQVLYNISEEYLCYD